MRNISNNCTFQQLMQYAIAVAVNKFNHQGVMISRYNIDRSVLEAHVILVLMNTCQQDSLQAASNNLLALLDKFPMIKNSLATHGNDLMNHFVKTMLDKISNTLGFNVQETISYLIQNGSM